MIKNRARRFAKTFLRQAMLHYCKPFILMIFLLASASVWTAVPPSDFQNSSCHKRVHLHRQPNLTRQEPILTARSGNEDPLRSRKRNVCPRRDLRDKTDQPAHIADKACFQKAARSSPPYCQRKKSAWTYELETQTLCIENDDHHRMELAPKTALDRFRS